MANPKQSAMKLLDSLPDQVGWDEIMYEFYVKQKIDLGLQAAEAGDTINHADIRARLLTDEA